VWSPDSTRLARLTHDGTRVRIYGIDGSILAELTPPAGYTMSRREMLLIWAPGGRSVWVELCPPEGAATPGGDSDSPPCAIPEHWELPINGSAPRRVATDLASLEVSGLTFSPDGTRLAFVARSAGTRDDYVLYVAEPDGSNRTPVIRADDGPSIWIQHLSWSPGSDAIAYRNQAAGGSEGTNSHSVKVVDIATGTARTLVPDLSLEPELLRYSWSPDGTRLLLSGGESPWRDGLWTIAVAGGDPTPLVEVPRAGELQPIPLGE
jgi:Tol biopolymer transport system component